MRCLLALALLLATACAGTRSSRYAWPDLGKRAFWEARTDHVTLRTDLADPRLVAELAVTCERGVAMLAQTYGLLVGGAKMAGTPIQVLHIESCERLERATRRVAFTMVTLLENEKRRRRVPRRPREGVGTRAPVPAHRDRARSWLRPRLPSRRGGVLPGGQTRRGATPPAALAVAPGAAVRPRGHVRI